MHWISPSDEGTYDSLLSHIGGDGGVDDLITAVTGVSPPHVKSLVMARKGILFVTGGFLRK